MVPFLDQLLGGPRRRNFIVIDIGSNTAIRSLRFHVTDGAAFAAAKHHFELPRRSIETDLIPFISEYLRRMIFRYVKDIGRLPDEIMIGLGNHFTFNEIVTVGRVRPHADDPMQGSELESIVQEFLISANVKTVDQTRYTLAHLMPFRIALDGYHLQTAGRQVRGKNIEMIIFATYARDEFWQALGKVQSMFGGLTMRFVSDQAAIAAAIIALLEVRDALIVKIGSKITEVSLLGEGVLLSTGQFTKGGEAVTNAIAKNLNVSHADAERIKRQWDKTILPPKAASLVEEAAKLSVEEWLSELTTFLKKEERFLLPEQIFILGGGARLKIIREALENRLWYSGLTFLEKLNIQTLEAEAMAERIFQNTHPLLKGPEEVALAALARRAYQSPTALSRPSAEIIAAQP